MEIRLVDSCCIQSRWFFTSCNCLQISTSFLGIFNSVIHTIQQNVLNVTSPLHFDWKYFNASSNASMLFCSLIGMMVLRFSSSAACSDKARVEFYNLSSASFIILAMPAVDTVMRFADRCNPSSEVILSMAVYNIAIVQQRLTHTHKTMLDKFLPTLSLDCWLINTNLIVDFAAAVKLRSLWKTRGKEQVKLQPTCEDTSRCAVFRRNQHPFNQMFIVQLKGRFYGAVVGFLDFWAMVWMTKCAFNFFAQFFGEIGHCVKSTADFSRAIRKSVWHGMVFAQLL